MPVLIVLAPPSAGVRFPVNPEGLTTIGRDPGCDVTLPKRSLSRHHARILLVADRCYLEDCQSTNGTFLNGHRVTGRSQLQDGDIINLHDLPLCFSLIDLSTTDEDATEKLPPPDAIHAAETEHAVPVFTASPGATLLKGRLDSLISAAQHLGSSLDPEDVPLRVLGLLFQMFPQATRGEVYLADNRNELQCVAEQGDGPAHFTTTDDTPVDRQHLHDVFASGQGAIHTKDVEVEDNSSPASAASYSAICAPITGATQQGLGVLVLSTGDIAHAFTPDDLGLVSAVGVLTGQAIGYSRTHQLLLQLERTQVDFDAARDIQMGMVRHTRPKVPGYRFADYYNPAQKVGGDYYFYETLPDGRVIVGIADASGKGLAAAMAIARFAGEVRFRIATSPTLKKALSDLNRFVAEAGPLTFITSCVCVLDPGTHSLTIANAGHLPPLRRRRDAQEIDILETPRGGLPLGIDERSICHPVTVTVEPGDRILLLTDGATEAMNRDEQLYGIDRLKQAMSVKVKSLDEYVAGIVADIDSYRDGRTASDDVCLVAMERTK